MILIIIKEIKINSLFKKPLHLINTGHRKKIPNLIWCMRQDLDHPDIITSTPNYGQMSVPLLAKSSRLAGNKVLACHTGTTFVS